MSIRFFTSKVLLSTTWNQRSPFVASIDGSSVGV
jgi:hypothetical protein